MVRRDYLGKNPQVPLLVKHLIERDYEARRRATDETLAERLRRDDARERQQIAAATARAQRRRTRP